MANKKAFGGYTINFNRKDIKDTTVVDIFGTEPIANTEMTKRIWAFVKDNELGSTAPKEPKVYNTLEEYWDDVDYSKMNLESTIDTLVNMGMGTKANKALAKKVFALEGKKFNHAIDDFVEEIMEDYKPPKASKKKESKAKAVPEPVEEDEIEYATLQEYYDEVDYEDMKYNDFCAIMKKMGAKGQQFEAIKKIFTNGYIKNAKKFVADIDEFVEDFMDGYKLTTKKTSKKSSK